MRVLLDENVDRRLRPLFDPENEAVTAAEQGWSGEKSGELFRLAAAEFDAFVTMDRNLPHQQNLSDIDLAVVVILGRGNRRQDIEPAMPQVNRLLRVIKAKELQIVQA